MIKVDCPKCSRTINADDKYAGKTVKCPGCQSSVEIPAQEEEESVLGAELLAEVGAMKDKPSAPSPEGDEIDVEIGDVSTEVPEPIAQPEVAPPTRQRSKSAMYWINTITGVLAILLLLYIGWRYMLPKFRESAERAKAIADSRERITEEFYKATDFQESEEYAKAKATYSKVVELAKSHIAKYPDDISVEGYIEKAEEALKSEEIKMGSKGFVLFEGKWIPPKERERIEAERKGLVFYEGKYVTVEERVRREEKKMKAKGFVKFRGKWEDPKIVAELKDVEKKALPLLAKVPPKVAPPRVAKVEKPPRKTKETQQPKQTARIQKQPPQPPQPKRTASFAPDDSVWIIDDFESGAPWNAEKWNDSNTVTLEIGQTKANKFLIVNLKNESQPKTAFSKIYPPGLDVTSRDRLVVTVKNGLKRPVKLALSLQTGNGYQYFESPTIPLPGNMKEPKNVAFKIQEKNFKSAKSGWAHTTAVEDLNDLKKIIFLVQNHGDGKIVMDDVRMLAPGAPESAKRARRRKR